LEQRNGRIDRYGQSKTPYIYYLIGKSELEGLKTDLHIVENLTKKEEEVYKALGDAGSVLKLYDANAEENKLEEAIKDRNENFLFDNGDIEIDEDSLFGGDSDITETNISDEPIEKDFSLYNSDSEYYQDLFGQLKTDTLIQQNDAEFIDASYLEVKNTKELNSVLFDLPKEAKPKINDIYRLSLDKNTVQNAIDNARKKKGEWAKFQMLYDLHPVIKYMMTKLEASVDKEVALVAKINSIPKNTVYFVLHGQVANNIGQSVISDFFAIGFNLDGGMSKKPIPLRAFVAEYKINDELFTHTITDDILKKIKALLPDVVDFASETYMRQQQVVEQLRREKDFEVYKEHLKNWERMAKEQIELDFVDKQRTGFIKKRIEDKEHEIETIISKSSQYYKDLTSLNNDAYLQIISVFYNS
jgi:hypothetical protein